MGWGSVIGGAIGSIFGPTGAKWGAAAGGAWESKRKEKRDRSWQQRNSLSGRVAEAQAAGIHPLAALGYNAGGTVPGQSDSGAAVSDAIQQTANKSQRQANLELTNSEANRNMAETALLNSQAKRIQQAANSRHDGMPSSTTLTGPGQGKFKTSQSTPQQVVEDEYGGVVGEGYGMYRFLQDYMGPNRPGKKQPTKKEFKNWADQYAPKHGRRLYDFNRR